MVLISLGTGDREGVLCCPGPASGPVTMSHGGAPFSVILLVPQG